MFFPPPSFPPPFAPDLQGHLMVVINQVRVFEQNLLRVMKGLSRACEFYAKLLLNGVYNFLES